MQQWSRLGIDYREDYLFRVAGLDSQKQYGKAIYGNGFLAPRAAAYDAEIAAWEKRKELKQKELSDIDEKIAELKRIKESPAEMDEKYWQLSEREYEIIRELERQKEKGSPEHRFVKHTEYTKEKKTGVEKQISIFDKGEKK